MRMEEFLSSFKSNPLEIEMWSKKRMEKRNMKIEWVESIFFIKFLKKFFISKFYQKFSDFFK